MKILQLLILVCLGTAFLIGITSLVSIVLINEIASEVSENQTPKITTLYQMQILLEDATRDIFDFSRLEEAPQRQEFQAVTNDFQINADELRRLASTGDDEDNQLILSYDNLTKQFSHFKNLGERLISVQVNQSDKIVQRRALLNEQLDPIIDESLQRNLSPSDPQYSQKQQALLEMEINMHELFSASSGYVVRPDSSLKHRVDGSITDFQYWFERFLALNGYLEDNISNDKDNDNNNSTGSIPVTTTSSAAAAVHRSLLAGKVTGVVGATGTVDVDDNTPTAIISVISPQSKLVIISASTTIDTDAAPTAANPRAAAHFPSLLLLQRIQNADQTLQDTIAIKRGFDIVSKLTQEIISLEDIEQNQLVELTRVESELDDLLDNKMKPIILQEIQALENSADGMVNIALVSIVIAILSAVILGIVISSHIVKPIKRLRDAVNEVEAGNLDARVVGIDDGGTKKGGGEEEVGGRENCKGARSITSDKNSGTSNMRSSLASEELTDLSHSFNSMIEKLKSNDKMQREFLGVASHELRSPIQPILSHADLAIKGDLPYEQAVQTIFVQALRLQKLANDILDVARIEAGQLRYVMRRISINRVIKDAVDAITQNLAKEVHLEVQLLEHDVEIELDPDYIVQVLTNILGNAAKFTEKGKIRIEASRSSGDNNNNNSLIEIRISDTGGGIPEDILPRLFEKFATRDVAGKARHGTGLGLYISKAIVNAHNGKISAFNNPEGGATFVISLPIEQQKKAVKDL